MEESRRLVFISHAGADTWVARQIERELRTLGMDTFLDVANIPIGEEFPEAVRSGIQRADELLVLLTPWSLRRPWVRIEVGAAFQRAIPIVVVLYGLTEEDLRQDTSIPIFLLERNLVNLNEIERYLGYVSLRGERHKGDEE